MKNTRKKEDASVLTVGGLLSYRKLHLKLLTGGSGIDRRIGLPHLQKPGLILAGHLKRLNPEMIQVFGRTEIAYLQSLKEDELRSVAERFLAQKILCLIITKNLDAPPFFLELADRLGTPVLRSVESTSVLIKKLTHYLEKKLAPHTTMHGVLMSIQGVGVLILGKSGIGKSECALDLVYKGHRLVADDLIHLQKIGQDIIIGHGPEIIKHHMEIRGLGIINIKDLFGVISIMDSARVELVVELQDWNSSEEHDRLGLEEETIKILDVDIRRIRIPVSPGRNLSVILEVAARNYLLKKSGYHAAKSVDATLKKAIRENSSTGQSGG